MIRKIIMTTRSAPIMEREILEYLLKKVKDCKDVKEVIKILRREFNGRN